MRHAGVLRVPGKLLLTSSCPRPASSYGGASPRPPRAGRDRRTRKCSDLGRSVARTRDARSSRRVSRSSPVLPTESTRRRIAGRCKPGAARSLRSLRNRHRVPGEQPGPPRPDRGDRHARERDPPSTPVAAAAAARRRGRPAGVEGGYSLTSVPVSPIRPRRSRLLAGYAMSIPEPSTRSCGPRLAAPRDAPPRRSRGQHRRRPRDPPRRRATNTRPPSARGPSTSSLRRSRPARGGFGVVSPVGRGRPAVLEVEHPILVLGVAGVTHLAPASARRVAVTTGSIRGNQSRSPSLPSRLCRTDSTQSRRNPSPTPPGGRRAAQALKLRERQDRGTLVGSAPNPGGHPLGGGGRRRTGVLLGDVVELRDLPLGPALEAARPFFEELGEAVGGAR